MKINIIGPSCVGKTTIARKLASRHKVLKHVDLDLCFNDFERLKKTGVVSSVSVKKGLKKLRESIVGVDSWVIEGAFPVKEVLEEADLIVYVRYGFVVPLYFQWRRYRTDRLQRITYGFKANLLLTWDILQQYFSKRGLEEMDSPVRYSVRKYEVMLKDYKKKLFRLKKPYEMKLILTMIENCLYKKGLI